MQLILSGMVNICQVVAVIPTFMYLDRVGRRTMAICGGLAMAIPHLIIAGLMKRVNNQWTSNEGLGWFCVALICMIP